MYYEKNIEGTIVLVIIIVWFKRLYDLEDRWSKHLYVRLRTSTQFLLPYSTRSGIAWSAFVYSVKITADQPVNRGLPANV